MYVDKAWIVLAVVLVGVCALCYRYPHLRGPLGVAAAVAAVVLFAMTV
ncbi:hypothetical protein ACQP00_49690 [Dactylosporangium sp. CS-047395]